MKKVDEASKEFRAFGKTFTRKQAEWLIFSEWRTNIIYAHNTDVLADFIRYGWKGVEHWNDQELQAALNHLLEEMIVYRGKDIEGIDLPGLTRTLW